MNFRQKLLLFFGLFGFLCLLLPNTATADSFDWTYQGIQTSIPVPPINFGSGELTTTNGVITELSGTFDGLSIAGLLPPGAFAGNDNLLLVPAAPLYVTMNGFSFVDSAGTQFNIYASLGTQCQCVGSVCTCVPSNLYVALNGDTFGFDFGEFTLAPIATPEPAAMAMLLSAVLGFGLFLGWKRLGSQVFYRRIQ